MFADLSEADLGAASLRDAKLLGAEGITREELEQPVAIQGVKGGTVDPPFLGGATMPDGTVLPKEYYTTTQFHPALSLSFGQEGWTHAPGSQEMSTPGWSEEVQSLPFVMDIPDELSADGSVGGHLSFTNPSDVFDPSTPSELNAYERSPEDLEEGQLRKVPEPENADEWISWFQRHPNLDVSKPVPVSMGGASGMRIDVTASSTPDNPPQDL